MENQQLYEVFRKLWKLFIRIRYFISSTPKIFSVGRTFFHIRLILPLKFATHEKIVQYGHILIGIKVKIVYI